MLFSIGSTVHYDKYTWISLKIKDEENSRMCAKANNAESAQATAEEATEYVCGCEVLLASAGSRPL